MSQEPVEDAGDEEIDASIPLQFDDISRGNELWGIITGQLWATRHFDSVQLKCSSLERQRVRHIHVATCSDRSTDLCRPSETHFDCASVDTYLDSSTNLYRPSEEHFD
ncbi:hypothetical protein QJS10_CPA10g00850 [Acorus calamus]|uniref:Uncharacterized protein n=1 Tax=Acorus calamus TaxID=4465 RepID=A0AAV9DZY8_ACOCL|nr:hypothetical protein QJS10_CPA10g00850 [Acorus calamus]